MSKCSANWAIVRSPLMAASATFALKAGEWFRRGRLFMVSPVHGDYRRCQAEIPLIVLSRFPRPALLYGFLHLQKRQVARRANYSPTCAGRRRDPLVWRSRSNLRLHRDLFRWRSGGRRNSLGRQNQCVISCQADPTVPLVDRARASHAIPTTSRLIERSEGFAGGC